MDEKRYEVVADNGVDEVLGVRYSRSERCEITGNAILEGVIASMKIEDEPVADVRLKRPVNLPEALLVTRDPISSLE